MNKNRMRLTESQLHNVIKESVNRVLNENFGNIGDAIYTGAIHNKKMKPKEADRYSYKKSREWLNIADRYMDYLRHIRDYIGECSYGNPRVSKEYVQKLYNAVWTLMDAFDPKKSMSLMTAYANKMYNHSGKEDNEPEDWYERNEHGDFDNY